MIPSIHSAPAVVLFLASLFGLSPTAPFQSPGGQESSLVEEQDTAPVGSLNQASNPSNPLSSAEAEALVERGNRLYQDGAFQEALAAYEGVAAAGYQGADLDYNLGNAYFKTGNLGRSILHYERALNRRPGDPDATANLALARSLTADEIEPLQRFWLFSALSWWVSLLPRAVLLGLVVLAYLLLATGLSIRILSRSREAHARIRWIILGALTTLVLLGSTLLARDGLIGGSDWGVILVEEVAVQSAPSPEDDLTLFHIHEGTKVRLDQGTDEWSEVVLEDGRVGWVPSGVLETI